MDDISLEEVERVNLRFHNDFARRRGWEEDPVSPPLRDIKAFLGCIPGKRMLDVGCGWAYYIDHFLKAGLDYVGIDHSPEIIAAARSAHPSEQFEVMSFRAISFPDRSFDGAWACCAFSGEPKRNIVSVLQEIRRVLVPGGVFSIVMPLSDWGEERMVRDDAGAPLLFHAAYDLPEFSSLVTKAGFRIFLSYEQYENGAMSVYACA